MKIRSVLVYTVLRLAFFVVPFALMMLLPAFHSLWWLAAIFAAVIGLSLSILFLRRPLADVSEGLQERSEKRKRPKTAREIDDEIENAANDAVRGDQADPDAR
ncbi:DUF4229 domain-containing protein [Microbacterium sp. gxy059]|uniref:DUF4229 domain-containing protein n=1 Tax=Microbacterium sp. gxy059 TaxID=2957199 RepID=UPI003D98B5F4